MNDNTLITVHGYAGDADRVARHMPLYLHHECAVMVLSPEDARISHLGLAGTIKYHIGGKRAYIGQLSLDRQHEHLKILACEPYEWFLANDSDSFCVSPRIPEYLYLSDNVFWSVEVTDPRPHPSSLPKLALQPPYFFHRSVLEKFLKVAPGIVMHPITQYIDHYMLQLVCASGVLHADFAKGPNDCVVMAHPVKTPEQMNKVLQDYAAANEC